MGANAKERPPLLELLDSIEPAVCNSIAPFRMPFMDRYRWRVSEFVRVCALKRRLAAPDAASWPALDVLCAVALEGRAGGGAVCSLLLKRPFIHSR